MTAPMRSPDVARQAGDSAETPSAQRPKKLLVFDSWTQGSPHVIRLLDAFKARRIEVLLVHMGSWGDDPGRPQEENLQGLEARDISLYDTFDAPIRVERPDAVLFLSLDPILHRAFNRYCGAHGIPRVNLYPGLYSAQAYDSLSTDWRNIFSYWRWAATRLVRTLRYVFPIYAGALIRTRAGIRDWGRFAREIYDKFAGINSQRASSDAVTEHVCVFNALDAEHARQKYGIPLDRISIVGIPDIIKFKGLEDRICLFTAERSELNETVLYIGTGVRGQKMKLASDQDYLDHLVETAEALRRHGKKLVCKLHYSRTAAIEALAAGANADIAFCTDATFVETMATACGVIIEPSTAGLAPILMGKPVYLARYGRLTGLPYGSLLSAYPKARELNSLADLALVALPFDGVDVAQTDEWIRTVAGPLPASDMPARVAAVVDSAIQSTNAATGLRGDVPAGAARA